MTSDLRDRVVTIAGSAGSRTLPEERLTDDELETIQRRILDTILSKVPLHDDVHGHRRGRSVIDFHVSPRHGARLHELLTAIEWEDSSRGHEEGPGGAPDG